MKIVHIEDFFHPDAGYQINIMPKYLQSFGHENVIITSEITKIPENLKKFFDCNNIERKDDLFTERTGVKVIRVPILKYISGRSIFLSTIFKILKQENPDVIYVHGNDTFIAIMLFLRRKQFKCSIITDSHMLDMASVNRFRGMFYLFYKKIITPIIIKNSITVIRTQDDEYVEQRLGIPLKNAPWISYGSDLQLFHPDINRKAEFKRVNRLNESDLIVIYAGKLDKTKGGDMLAEAFKESFKSKRNVVLVVVGSSTGEFGKEVDRLFNQSENRIIRFETQKYYNLPKYFQVADICVFAKQCSLSFYDAQACGLPVISEDNKINVERCAYNNGWNFKSGNIEDFREKIKMVADMSQEELTNYSKNAVKYIEEYYNYEKKSREYERIIKETYEKQMR